MKVAISRKNLWDRLPRAIKVPLGRCLSVVPLPYVLGKRFRNTMRFALDAQWWPAERAREYQLAQLRKICQLAYNSAPFYQRLFRSAGFHPEDLKDPRDLLALPTINRQTIAESLDDMCVRSVYHPTVDRGSTGGTGGQPMFFYMGSERSATEYAYLVASWGRAGYRLGTPMAVLRGRVVRPDRHGLRHEYDPLFRHHYYSNFHMSEENMGRYLDDIGRLGPCFLHVYPSAAAALARFARRQGRAAPANVRGVIAESEALYPDQRRLVEDVFNCRILSCYGHSEKAVLAVACEQSNVYHVWPTYGYFELLDDQCRAVTTPGQRGEIVGTSFINTVVPFIRYRTGDYAVYVGDRCNECGREHVLIAHIEGRWPSGELVASDGSLISMTAVNIHDDTFLRVRQYQFFQDTPGQAVLRVVPGTGFSDQDSRRIHHSLSRKLGGRIAFTIEVTGSIALTPRGKFRYVDQRIGAQVSPRPGDALVR